MNAKRLFFLVMAICLANGVKAQLYGNDVYYYIPAGQSLTDKTEICIVYFSGKRIACSTVSCSKILQEIEKNPRYWKEELLRVLDNPNNGCEFDSSLTTSKRIVYKNDAYSYNPFNNTKSNIRYYYRAFTKDKTSMIQWMERNSSSDIEEKTYYKMVDVKDLIPQTVKHDFLYE